MNLLESGEDYLEAILMLSTKQKDVHAIDVANELNFSKPSVSIALKKLKEGGYIDIDEHNHLHLTDSGMEVAQKIYERHILLTQILIELGVDSEVAAKDPCKLEHDLTTQSFQAIKNYYNKVHNK
jgi:Mn-dependent DtxR family transcriptional regulator